MDVKIYKPSKNAMQSGRALDESGWFLEYETQGRREAEPLMGWTAADDTLNQVRLKFKSCEDAIAFAEKEGWSYTILKPNERRIKPRNYGDNFKYRPPEEQKKA